MRCIRCGLIVVASLVLAACSSPAVSLGNASANPLKVLAVETFLADIAQNVAGDRVKVEALMPIGLDPHAFEPAPADVAKIAESQVLIVNGAGLEAWLQRLLDNAGGQRLVVEASRGLAVRVPPAG